MSALVVSTNLASRNSQVEVYLDLCLQLISCDPLGLTSTKSLNRDLETVKSRVRDEGLSFLTKTLPRLGKALDRGLMDTRFSIPREFKGSHKNRSIPAFMQAYFKRVFGEEGLLLAEADPEAVKHLRQVCFAMYKLELPYSPADEARVIASFVETEQGGLEFSCEVGGVDEILAGASYLVRNVFQDFNPKDILPRHGPGAVATGERLDQKWEFSRLYRGIHQVYPYYEYFVVGGGRELIDRLDWYKSLERLDQGCAKVVLVPKDSRGPRLISCEPLEFQWVQQGLGRKMMAHLESHRTTRGQINFTRQEINQELARQSSIDGRYATLDLKDASDRVSLELVRELFKHNPQLLRALEACRTTATTLPDGRVQQLKKYAPMGSALCFPVEAVCFWALIVAAIMRETRLPLASVGKDVFVYGDDIIVPTEYAHLSMQTLELFALRVNRDKCCIKGPFRESCGYDAFKGVRVTPIRFRKPWTGRRTDGAAYASYISIANSLSQSGYTACSDLIWDMLKSVYGDIPYGTKLAAYPCRIVDDPAVAEEYNSQRFRRKFSKRYQRLEFLLPKVSPRKLKTKLDGWLRMLRNSVLERLDDPLTIVVPRSIQIKRGWTAVY